jgi:hypothetical protein
MSGQAQTGGAGHVTPAEIVRDGAPQVVAA